MYMFLRTGKTENYLEGPKDQDILLTCSFMWPEDKMPDPSGGKRLLDRGCKVTYEKDTLLKPREIKSHQKTIDQAH